VNVASRFILVGVGDELLAFAADQVEAVVERAEIFVLPQLSPGFAGVVLYRGKPVPVCLAAVFQAGGALTAPYLLLGRTAYGLVAFPVDRVLTTVGGEMWEETEAREIPPIWQAAWIRCQEGRVPLVDIERLLATLG